MTKQIRLKIRGKSRLALVAVLLLLPAPSILALGLDDDIKELVKTHWQSGVVGLLALTSLAQLRLILQRCS